MMSAIGYFMNMDPKEKREVLAGAAAVGFGMAGVGTGVVEIILHEPFLGCSLGAGGTLALIYGAGVINRD